MREALTSGGTFKRRFAGSSFFRILGGTLRKATRKLRVVRLGLRQMDGIGFRPLHNLENQSESYSHFGQQVGRMECVRQD